MCIKLPAIQSEPHVMQKEKGEEKLITRSRYVRRIHTYGVLSVVQAHL